MSDDWTVFVTGPDRVVTGVADTWSGLDITLRMNAGGVWSLTLPEVSAQAALFTPGARIVAYHGDRLVMSGPVRAIGSAVASGSATASVTVSGVDDTARLAGRIVWPDWANAANAQTIDYYDATGPAETVLRALVDRQCGPSALTARQWDGLTLTTDQGLGATIEIQARWQPLLDVMSEAATAGGVVFEVQQTVTGDLELSFREPIDRSADIRLSRDLGTLANWSLTRKAAAATRAIVGGQGDLSARAIVERAATGPEAEWACRDEAFVDARDADDAATLEQRGDAYLMEKAATAGLSLTPIDTPNRRFGTDYGLGDTVTVEVGGATFTDQVTEVRLTAGADGTTVKPAVGDRSISGDTPALYRRVSELTRRIATLEGAQ